MKIIRHCDDFGITHQSTKHLIAAWRAGDLDSFSIIANGEAVKLISETGAAASQSPARIAVHFNLTEGFSMASAADIPLLVDKNGRFKHSFVSLLMVLLISRARKKQLLKKQIAIECRAQINFIRSLCGAQSITAIDSHNHIHMIPSIFDTVAQCAYNAGIFVIRIAAEPFYLDNPRQDWRQSFWWINLIKHFLLRFLSRSARRKIQTFGLNAPDKILGVLYSGKMTASRAESGLKAALSAGASEIEIIFHIGRATPAEANRWKKTNEAKFHCSEWRDIERYELNLFKNLMHNNQG